MFLSASVERYTVHQNETELFNKTSCNSFSNTKLAWVSFALRIWGIRCFLVRSKNIDEDEKTVVVMVMMIIWWLLYHVFSFVSYCYSKHSTRLFRGNDSIVSILHLGLMSTFFLFLRFYICSQSFLLTLEYFFFVCGK